MEVPDVSDDTRSPAQHRADQRRRKIRAARTESAHQTFAGLERGCEIVCLTHGQFSIIHAIEALLEHTGPAAVTISTWSAAHADLEHASRFLADGRVTAIRFLVDRSFVSRQPDYCATLRRLYGDDAIRVTSIHAKFVVIRGDDWTLAVRTSMNLNENPRLELIEVSDDPALADFLDGEVDSIYAVATAGDFSRSTSRHADLPATTASTVVMGRRVRVGAD